jgi:transcriptional regulator with XRE-family HTH domain
MLLLNFYIMKPGEKIKLQREDKKFNLSEVAQRAQLDQEHLEKIESGEVTPSLGILIKLARVLGVRPGTFLDDEEEKGVVVTRKENSESPDHMNASGSEARENLDFTSLARQKSNRSMDPFLIEVHPGDTKEPKFSTHEGEEFIYVLEGRVEVVYGKEIHILKAGDSIYYDSIVDHSVNAVEERALVLAVVYLPV